MVPTGHNSAANNSLGTIQDTTAPTHNGSTDCDTLNRVSEAPVFAIAC